MKEKNIDYERKRKSLGQEKNTQKVLRIVLEGFLDETDFYWDPKLPSKIETHTMGFVQFFPQKMLKLVLALY